MRRIQLRRRPQLRPHGQPAPSQSGYSPANKEAGQSGNKVQKESKTIKDKVMGMVRKSNKSKSTRE